jgi:hypothetical protein
MDEVPLFSLWTRHPCTGGFLWTRYPCIGGFFWTRYPCIGGFLWMRYPCIYVFRVCGWDRIGEDELDELARRYPHDNRQPLNPNETGFQP